jgi:pantetheine-phosphate adenylyltransferase
MKRALTPGTFDPITAGHLDVISRASQLVDEVIVAVAASPNKKPLFSLDERVALAKQATRNLGNVKVVPFDGLLVDFAEKMGVTILVKGLRAITDFEYEFQMTAINYQINRAIETIFIMSPPQYMYLSSSIVREIASLNGDINGFVPECVKEALLKKFPVEASTSVKAPNSQ